MRTRTSTASAPTHAHAPPTQAPAPIQTSGYSAAQESAPSGRLARVRPENLDAFDAGDLAADEARSAQTTTKANARIEAEEAARAKEVSDVLAADELPSEMSGAAATAVLTERARAGGQDTRLWELKHHPDTRVAREDVQASLAYLDREV